jgi:DNA repair protein RadC
VELLAILLRTGMAGKTVFQLSEELLAPDGIAGLLKAGAARVDGNDLVNA